MARPEGFTATLRSWPPHWGVADALLPTRIGNVPPRSRAVVERSDDVGGSIRPVGG
jgi:hypothetical protein